METVKPLHESYFKFIQPPPTVGYWVIGGAMHGLKVSQVRRPRWLTRVLCKWLLEWEWLDHS